MKFLGSIPLSRALMLAPMEDVTDLSFRLICRELGADLVFTEFVNSEGLVRGNQKTHKKLRIHDEERPVGIQIYGNKIESMVAAAKIAEQEQPDLIDINAGCWVRNVVGCGAGAALLKDPDYLMLMVKSVVDSVALPVTVKTRLGWDLNSINIIEIARRLQDTGIAGLTIHTRTRSEGNSGEAHWEWINKVKEVVEIPVTLNGNLLAPEDVKRAFAETAADAVMIARGAVGYPWIFKETKELLTNGEVSAFVNVSEKIAVCIRHLSYAVQVKGERRGVLEHRKFYTGYLKGFHCGAQLRSHLMTLKSFSEVEDALLRYVAAAESGNIIELLAPEKREYFFTHSFENSSIKFNGLKPAVAKDALPACLPNFSDGLENAS